MSDELTGIVMSDGTFSDGWTDSIPESLRDNESINGAENFNSLLSDYAELKGRPVETPKGLANENGEFSENWYEQLGEDYKDNASLKNFTTVEGLAKSYLNTKSMVGKKQTPGEFASDEDRAEFFKSLGKPDTSDGYEFSKPENVPEDMPYSEERDIWFGNIAHKYNLTKEQAQGMRNEWNEMQIESHNNASKEVDAEYDASTNALKEEWGNAYEDKVNLANKAVSTYSAAETLQRLGLDNNPDLVKLFANIGASMSEDQLVTGKAITSDVMSPSEAKEKIAEINSNPAFTNPDHPMHKELIRKQASLFKMAYPE